MDWASIGLALLKLVLGIMRMIENKQQFKAGQDSEIAKTAVAILQKTEAGKKLMEKINAMDDDDLGDLIDALGRPDSGSG